MSEKMCLKLGAHNSGSNPQRIYHYLKAIRPSYSVSGTGNANPSEYMCDFIGIINKEK